MMYTLNEVCGRNQGQIIMIDAQNAIEAMKKAGMTCWVRSYEKFSKAHNGRLYEVYETEKPDKVEYICHR